MGLHEVHDAASVIRGAVHEDADVIFGAVSDETLEDELRVTVIATGLDHRQAETQGLARQRGGEDPQGSGPPAERGRRQRLRDTSVPPDTKGAMSDVPAYVRRRFR